MKNIVYIITFFTVLLGFFENTNAQEQQSYQKLEKRALQHLVAEEWYLATPLFVQLNHLKPENAENAFIAGKCYFQIDNKAESLKYFVKALKLGHDSEQLNFYLGRAYHFNLVFDSAIFYYQEYLKDPQTTIENKPDIQNIIYRESISYKKSHQLSEEMNPANLTRTQKAGYSEDKYVNSRTLKPLEKGQKVVLNNLYFDFNKSTLTAESTVELNNLFNMLEKHNSLYAKISGHTDNLGSKKINKRLSERRAKAVQDYLVYKGIDKKRLSMAGYGDEKPLVNNITPEGRKINRRTEFEILNFDKNSNEYNNEVLQEDEDLNIISGYISDAALPFKAHFLFNDGNYLTEYSKKRLNRILEFAKYEKDLSLIIVGYEDIDTEDHNKNLSSLRAESVYKYLVRNGLAKERINVVSEKRNFLPSETGVKRRKVEFYLSRS